jgi:hypothetical protein
VVRHFLRVAVVVAVTLVRVALAVVVLVVQGHRVETQSAVLLQQTRVRVAVAQQFLQ